LREFTCHSRHEDALIALHSDAHEQADLLIKRKWSSCRRFWTTALEKFHEFTDRVSADDTRFSSSSAINLRAKSSGVLPKTNAAWRD
jgi:hypothetical protein